MKMTTYLLASAVAHKEIGELSAGLSLQDEISLNGTEVDILDKKLSRRLRQGAALHSKLATFLDAFDCEKQALTERNIGTLETLEQAQARVAELEMQLERRAWNY